MSKWISILFASLFLILIVFFPYITDSKDSPRPMREITALTTIPPALTELISEEYEKKYKIRVTFEPLTENQDMAGVSLVLSDKNTLNAAKKNFSPYLSTYWDLADNAMKEPEALWTGVCYDPIVFSYNRDYLRANKNAPLSWQNLAKANNIRIGMTDFLAADAQANLMFSMIAQYGDAVAFQIWRGIHPKVVQYAKYLNNPVRQAGMGEVDVAIAVLSESIRYLNDDYPLKIIYPRDGTAYMLIGTGIVKDLDPADEVAARDFADWLQTDEAHQLLQSRGFYFIPVNRDSLTYKSFAGKDLYLYTQYVDFTKEQRHDFLDRWVKYIRLGGKIN